MFDNQKVREILARVVSDDAELGEELKSQLDRPMREVAFAPQMGDRAKSQLTPETIVLRTGRPVLAIRNNDVVLEFREAESKVWKERITEARSRIRKPILAVGRIDLVGHPDYSWVGTGWLVRSDILATNRHVAELFARRSSDAFAFRLGTDRKPMSASIDFLRELDNEDQLAFRIQDVLHIEDDDGPDLALMRVSGVVSSAPIALATEDVNARQLVAVIGYPARDSRIPDHDLMQDLFGNVYDCKRLAPGQIKEVREDTLLHDCSTLGGNSGSVVLDLASGKALGIHFAGRFLQANFAVPARLIEARVQSVEAPGGRRLVKRPEGKKAGSVVTVSPTQVQLRPGAGAPTLECIIPLKLTLEVGAPLVSSPSVVTAAPPSVQMQDGSESDDAEFEPEAAPADYLNREGYVAGFLGDGIEIPLPEIERDASKIVTFDFDGNAVETELRYVHFSVVMHRSRRMCFYSAVNIDGKLSRKTKRPGWALDPRIPKELQIMKECYGNPPKFSRGHMTRREDPAWGATTALAQRGNADSMHVTNAVPQMQIFNAGIWLGLEDYALQNAREDDMKICVFTGPIFEKRDPVRFGIKVPIAFWKVIAFVHDATGRLSATGYSISQEKFLSTEEFVFGAYETFQRSLSWIEKKAGLSFGALTARDRFEDTEEGFEKSLRDFGQIRFG